MISTGHNGNKRIKLHSEIPCEFACISVVVWVIQSENKGMPFFCLPAEPLDVKRLAIGETAGIPQHICTNTNGSLENVDI